ncbi:MAG: AsmA family protein, partial [Chitinophagales bacterium]|nr:AsmA family protein [Chitinophagales bacterium]
MFRKVIFVALVISAIWVSLAATLFVVFNLPFVQTHCAQQAAKYISDKLGTEVKVGSFRLSISRNIHLEDVLIRDLQGDTFIAAKKINIQFSGSSLLLKSFKVKAVRLEGAHVHLQRDSAGQLNLKKLFGLKQKKQRSKPKNSFDFKLDVNEINLIRTHFDYVDNKSGTTVEVDVDRLLGRMKDLGLRSKHMQVDKLSIVNPLVKVTINPPHRPEREDTLKPVHFMIGDLKISYKDVLITNGQVKVNHLQKPYTYEGMDYNHLDIKTIYLNVHKGCLNRDTIKASLRKLSAREKCGLVLTQLRGETLITPQMVLCNKMMLQTPQSFIANAI